MIQVFGLNLHGGMLHQAKALIEFVEPVGAIQAAVHIRDGEMFVGFGQGDAEMASVLAPGKDARLPQDSSVGLPTDDFAMEVGPVPGGRSCS